MADWVNAGRVKIVPQGDWDASVSYYVDDVVSHKRFSYVCRQNNIGQEPVSGQTSTYWQLFGSNVDGDGETTEVTNEKISVIDYVSKTYVDEQIAQATPQGYDEIKAKVEALGNTANLTYTIVSTWT